MPPEADTITTSTPAPSGAQEVAALEGAFSKAIDGGARGRDPVTKRFTSVKAAPANADDAPADTNSSAAPAQGDGAAPQAEEAAPSSDATEQQTKAEPSTETPIEPPASWSKENADRFRALPREAQEIVAQRERERDVELRRGQNETAETRKAAEAERKAISQERQQLAQQASLYVSEQERRFLTDYADVKDLGQLAREDGNRYVQMMADLEGIKLQKAQHFDLQQRVRHQAAQELGAFRAAEDKAYREEHGLADDAKWEAARKELADHAKERGVGDDEMAQASRAHLSIIRDAMLYRRSQKALNTAKAAGQGTTPAPRVQTPGTARGGDGKDSVAAALMKRVRAEHSTEAVEDAFAHALSKGAQNGSGKRNVR